MEDGMLLKSIARNLIGALIGVVALAGMAQAQTVELRLGHVDVKIGPAGVAGEAFAAAVTKLSNGTMKINMFHGGALGAGQAEIANTFSGAQDMFIMPPTYMGTYAKEAKFIDLPYVFNNVEHLQKFYMSDLWRPAIDKTEAQGGLFLDDDWTWHQKDPRGFIAVRPVFTPSELKGLKMRVWSSPTVIKTWEGFGAIPAIVPRPEMYLAFKQKIIEGGPETVGVAHAQKNMEMAKYWIRTEEFYQIPNIMMNIKKYNSLTAEQQNILRKAAKVGGKAYQDVTMANFEGKKMLGRVNLGVSIIEPALGPWRKAAAATIAKMEAEGYLAKGIVAKIKALDK
jgi:TRAP-type C4-dicarboxylate transport system substrate-binding protein